MVKISTNVKKFITNLEEHPDDFTFNGYNITHKDNGVSVWVSSGFWFFEFYQPTVAFSFFEKMYAWSPIIKFLRPLRKRNKIIESMEQEKRNHKLDQAEY